MRDQLLRADEEPALGDAPATADHWLELSDISGDDLWESKALALECRSVSRDSPLKNNSLGIWDVMIPNDHENVLEALAQQRFQDSRFIFHAGVHVNPGWFP